MNILTWIVSISLILVTIKQVKESPAEVSCKLFSTEPYDASRYECHDGLFYRKGELRKGENLGSCPEGVLGWMKSRSICLLEDKTMGYTWIVAKRLAAFLLPYFVPTPVRIIVHSVLNALDVNDGWFAIGSRFAQLGVGAALVCFVVGQYVGGSTKRRVNGRFSK